jgi:formylglycine-generating enzyme required for sulfatase activity
MDWIDIGSGVEIMRDPVTEVDMGRSDKTFPSREVTLAEAEEWAGGRGWRLPTEEEWLRGWGKMNHWGLWEWTTTMEKESAVLRGGAWVSYQDYAACAYRFYLHPQYRYSYVGFRCARTS